jgi:hypothetical protein
VWGYDKTGKQISSKFSLLMNQFVARNQVVVFNKMAWVVFKDDSEFVGNEQE